MYLIPLIIWLTFIESKLTNDISIPTPTEKEMELEKEKVEHHFKEMEIYIDKIKYYE